MTKIYVWPDATWLEADQYSEHEYGWKGDDFLTIDLDALASGKTAVADLKYEEVVGFYRFSELLQAEQRLKTTTSMFRNYRNTMREMTWEIPHLKDTIKKLEADYQGALARVTELEQSPAAEEVARLSREMSDLIAKHEAEMKEVMRHRDEWVKELQDKLSDANKLLANSEEVNEELENRIAVLSAQPPSPSFQGDLAEENRRLKSRLAGATARIRKQIDGYGRHPIRPEDDWEYRAKRAEAELAKLKNTAAISSDIEDNLRKERDWYDKLLTKHGVCTDCGDMYEHHEDEPLASCSCQTAEWWGSDVSTPFMLLQRALLESQEAMKAEAQRADDAEQRAQDLRNEMDAMKHEITTVISRLQEIES